MTTIISSFLAMIDSAVLQMVQTAYGSLAGNMKTTFAAMLTLYVVWWGYLVIMGKTTAMPLEIAERIGKVVFIYVVATQWSAFSTLIYDVAMKMPDAIGSAIMSASGGTVGESGVVAALNRTYDAGAQLVNKVYVGSYFDIIGALLALAVLVGMLLFIAAVMAIMIATKLLMAGVLALGPIFIILAMFGYTFRFTDGYFRALASLMVSMILVYAFLGVYAGLLDKAIQNIGAGGDLMARIGVVAPFLFVCICGLLVVTQIPVVAAAITGAGASGVGIGASALNMGGRMAAVGAGVASQAFKGVRPPMAGANSARAAMQENLKRIGRPPAMDGEVLPPVRSAGAVTQQRQIGGPPRQLPPPGDE